MDDYRDRFDWIDYIQPVTDPVLVDRLNRSVITRIRSRRLDGLSLAPPEIVDWDRVTSFRYPFDMPQGAARSRVSHPELRLADYVAGLNRTGKLPTLEVDRLRSSHIRAVDGDGTEQYDWTAWQCLVAEVTLHGDTFILDEGDFFRVRHDYLTDLNAAIEGITPAAVSLPTTTTRTHEGDYNEQAAGASNDLLLLDRQTVRISTHTTAIEVCDLLTRSRQLIHIKRHLGSSDLSHLFSQGLVSAELLQMSPEFRRQALAKIASLAGSNSPFELWDESSFNPAEFEIVYGIIDNWRGRRCAEGLPFFSKVNLREVATNLRSRGFKVGLTPAFQ